EGTSNGEHARRRDRVPTRQRPSAPGRRRSRQRPGRSDRGCALPLRGWTIRVTQQRRDNLARLLTTSLRQPLEPLGVLTVDAEQDPEPAIRVAGMAIHVRALAGGKLGIKLTGLR